ncbi:unnamed protein product [Clonostachys rosea]|uniref:Dehydrogenase (DH) domain-containing protein n=1 Tax=Bionectria ochroleuca TaxID=29856 RepID=A0ABY6V3M6_BIOOC|nr:unnamed protein product [Clonostachys rosea]
MALIKADGKPLSTFQIARVLSGERVIAVPSLWTNLHLDLLQCSFGKTTYVQPAQEDEGSAALHMIFESLAQVNNWRQSNSIAKLICRDKEIFMDNKICLYFDGEVAEMLRCATTFHAQPVAKNWRSPPFAAYVDLERLTRARQCYHEPSIRYAKTGEIAQSISRIKLRKATPPNPMYDPYIAAILIAMAQEQQASAFDLMPGPDVMQMTFRPKLVVSKPESAFVYLYETKINSTFLCKFSDPDVQPPRATSMDIQIKAMPTKPLYTLSQRLQDFVLPG